MAREQLAASIWCESGRKLLIITRAPMSRTYLIGGRQIGNESDTRSTAPIPGSRPTSDVIAVIGKNCPVDNYCDRVKFFACNNLHNTVTTVTTYFR